jgi:hypothetical protein
MERRRAVSGGEDDSGADGRVGMHELPRDVVVEIVARLENERDLAACARSCAAFRSAARSESVWRKLLANKLGAEASVVLPKRLIGEIVDDDDSSGRGGLRRQDVAKKRVFIVVVVDDDRGESIACLDAEV